MSHHHDHNDEDELEEEESEEEENHTLSIIRNAVAAVIMITALILEHTLSLDTVCMVLFLAVYIITGYSVIWGALKRTLKLSFFDEQQLMTIATVGAIIIGSIEEAAAVMLLYSIGELLEDYITDRSNDSVKELLASIPNTAHLIPDIDNPHETVDTEPDEIGIGSYIAVRPGEKIPLDGTVINGESTLDTSAITGESLPVSVSPSSTVTAGTINNDGLLIIHTDKLFKDSSISKIMEMAKESAKHKSNTERFITRFARIYTPAVLVLALLLAVIPPLFFNGEWPKWIYQALSLLVISCPCALVISIPLGYFCSIGTCSRNGILIKGSQYLDALVKTDRMFVDKTGTLTNGQFKVVSIVPFGIEEDELLRLAASAEQSSNHPLAKGLVAACNSLLPSSDFTEAAGKGIVAKVDGHSIIVGSDKLIHEKEIPHNERLCLIDGTALHVAVDGIYKGYITLSDSPYPGTRKHIRELKDLGINNITMLTGDNHVSAKLIANQIGIKDVRSELLPEEKVAIVKQAESEDQGKVFFVGDGINDVPVIAASDVGIAMGGTASAATIEAADIIINSSDISKLSELIRTARRTNTIVKENIVAALGIKAVFIVLATLGMTNMWLAVFADMGVTILAVLNSTRLLIKKH